MQRTDSSEKTLMLGKMKAGGEGDNRGWDGWMASLTQWTWVWVSSGSWWWTGRPGMLQSMGLQRVEHDWATKPNMIITMMNVRYEWMLVIINTFTYSQSLVWILSWNPVMDIMTPVYTGLSKQATDHWSSPQRCCTPWSPPLPGISPALQAPVIPWFLLLFSGPSWLWAYLLKQYLRVSLGGCWFWTNSISGF